MKEGTRQLISAIAFLAFIMFAVFMGFQFGKQLGYYTAIEELDLQGKTVLTNEQYNALIPGRENCLAYNAGEITWNPITQ